jgi:LmbE family N-acetylglucosaminyl deacetylase
MSPLLLPKKFFLDLSSGKEMAYDSFIARKSSASHPDNDEISQPAFVPSSPVMNRIGAKVNKLLSSDLLVVAPHMDDEILGCGGLMRLHEDKRRIHCIYASNGSRSPEAPLFWQRNADRNLTQIRERESREALREIGMRPEQAVFFGLPDGGLLHAMDELEQRLEHEINKIAPEFIFVPFRYDLHSDHVAVHRATLRLKRAGRIQGTVIEYFIYFQWRLIKGGDIRRHISQQRLIEVDISSVSADKRRALNCYRSQTSLFYTWQEQPILTAESVQLKCRKPEYFLMSDPGEPLSKCFSGGRLPILFAHYAQRLGKRRKDQLVAIFNWALRPAARQQG